MTSISRALAKWVANLDYRDLPPAVVDRAKGVTLHCLGSILLGSQTGDAKKAVKLVTEEESGVAHGATIPVDGSKVTRAGAAYAGSEMAFSGGKWDTFRMLTHPGTSIIPTALAAAESAGADGRQLVTAVAAAYEVCERLAADYIPTVMSRGFHAGPVFGIFGAAIAAAKLYGLSEDEVNSAIALCASLAGGNLEAPRCGGKALREGAAVRNAMLAVSLARQGHVGGDTVLEGDAGFYHAFAGSNKGELTYSFVGATRANLADITKDLGKSWIFLETLYRIYSISGYNIAHIDVTAALVKEHDIRPGNVERVEAVVNWLETQYPSPAFTSRREDAPPKPGMTPYYTAHAIVERGFPVLQKWEGGPPKVSDAKPEVLDIMKRVTMIPSHTAPLFGPRITIYTKDGKSYSKQGTGREFIWDFDEEARRLRDIVPGLPVSAARFDEIVETCRTLDTQPRAARLVELTIPDARP
ncbi:MAG TPA: MmgE/PrpD family protein [Burkholderiales bacterium]|nr:MmgE/PrpD family protein [Burkholderiales bacterium]